MISPSIEQEVEEILSKVFSENETGSLARQQFASFLKSAEKRHVVRALLRYIDKRISANLKKRK